MISIVERFRPQEQPAPRAARVLSDLRGAQSYHANYSTRHPFGAYNVSLSSVARRGLQLAEVLKNVDRTTMFLRTSNSKWESAVLEATDHFLDSLLEHLDDCKGVLRSFFPDTDSRDFKRVLAGFKAAVEPYRNHIGNIDNHLKHNQGRLRAISFQWPGNACLGYFVEGVVAPDTVGPSPQVHPDSNSAFSFNRNIPFHISGVFFVGAALATQLHVVDRRLTLLPASKLDSAAPDDWTRLIEEVANLPDMYFPGEAKSGIPRIRWSARAGGSIEYPSSRRRMPEPPNPSRVTVSYHGDGATNSFKIPYSNAA